MSIRKHLILLLSLLHVSVGGVGPNTISTKLINVTYIRKVIDTINYSKKFESYTVVVTNLLNDVGDEEAIWQFCQELFQNDMRPHILIYNNGRFKTDLNIWRILNLNSITIVFAINSQDNVLLDVSKILLNFKRSVVMVVVAKSFASLEDVTITASQTSISLVNKNIINSIIVCDNNTFNFELYPRYQTVNVTGKEHLLDLNASTRLNFKGYSIRTPIKKDIPRVFKSSDGTIHGMTGLLSIHVD